MYLKVKDCVIRDAAGVWCTGTPLEGSAKIIRRDRPCDPAIVPADYEHLHQLARGTNH